MKQVNNVPPCVIGIPDERVGERIKAFVVLKTDIKGVSAYELMRPLLWGSSCCPLRVADS